MAEMGQGVFWVLLVTTIFNHVMVVGGVLTEGIGRVPVLGGEVVYKFVCLFCFMMVSGLYRIGFFSFSFAIYILKDSQSYHLVLRKELLHVLLSLFLLLCGLCLLCVCLPVSAAACCQVGTLTFHYKLLWLCYIFK